MNHFEKSSLYWVFAILIIVIAPIVVLLTPVLLSVFVHIGPDQIAFITFGKNLIVYSLAFLLAFMGLIILYFVKKLVTKVIGVILTILGFLAVYATGLNYYLYLDENYIEYNPLIGSKVVYEWSELSHLRHIYPDDSNDKEYYIFTFHDGYTIKFEANGFVDSSVKSQIDYKAQSYNVPIERFESEDS